MAVASKNVTVQCGLACQPGVMIEPSAKVPDGTIGAWFTCARSDRVHYVLTPGAFPLCSAGPGRPVRGVRVLAGGAKVYCQECKRLAAERWRFAE